MRILFAAPVTFYQNTFFISQYVTGLAKAAIALGHDVRLVRTTENIYNPLIWGFIQDIFLDFRRRRKWLADIPHDLLLMNQVYNEVSEFEPDILFIHLVDTTYAHLILRKIKQKGTQVFTWLGVHPSQVSPGVHKLLRSVDCTLIYDSSYIEHYQKQLGINNVHILPLGCDIDYYNNINLDHDFTEKNGVDVCFVGIFDQHREKFLDALSDYNLGIWSWTIGRYETELAKFHKGIVYGDDLIKVYKSAKIVLNIHREFEESGGNYRLFEIPACGAFQLVDEKKDISRYFEIGKEVVTFKDKDDLRRKVEYYLKNPEKREEIARAGFNRVKSDHTLVGRMKKLIEMAETRNWEYFPE